MFESYMLELWKNIFYFVYVKKYISFFLTGH